MSSSAIQEFPPCTIAVAVHKHFVERVKEYLLYPKTIDAIVWKQSHSDEEATTTLQSHANDKNKNKNKNVTVLEITESTGKRHDRKGFHLLLVLATKRPIWEISPFARQNMSWVFHMTHHYQQQTTATATVPLQLSVLVEDVAQQILSTIPLDKIPLVLNDQQQMLRVNCYPKNYRDALCLSLQQHVYQKLQQHLPAQEQPKVPYLGPILLTRSANKCTHRLDVIIQSTPTSTPPEHATTTTNETTMDHHCYWGWLDRQSAVPDQPILDIRLNEFATQQLEAVAPDHVTGKDLVVASNNSEALPRDTTPVSRAYYKLDQVWTDLLESQKSEEYLILQTILQQQQPAASAVDFGSAPGGWTQVLAQRAPSLKAICAVDKGQMAERVMVYKSSNNNSYDNSVRQVHHIACLMEDCAPQLKPYTPFGIVVCDASQIWSELFDRLLRVVANLTNSTTDKNSNNNNPQQPSPPQQPTTTTTDHSCSDWGKYFTLPCILVITMKLPFQTPQSIQRHVRLIQEQLPQYLDNLKAAMYPSSSSSSSIHSIHSRHVLLHLMANSPSERTLLVIFERKEDAKV